MKKKSKNGLIKLTHCKVRFFKAFFSIKWCLRAATMCNKTRVPVIRALKNLTKSWFLAISLGK